MSVLKTCPFCGGDARIEKHSFHQLSPTYEVVCLRCGSRSSPWYRKEADAIAAWNRRGKQ